MSILGAIGSIATIVGAVYGIFKWITWKTASTPEGHKEGVDQDVSNEENQVKKTGRPKP